MLQGSRVALVGLVAVLMAIAPYAAGPPSALAATLKVCPHCRYTTIQDALNHSQNGDVIRIGRGAYSGPITILTSVRLEGLGSRSTTIRGHGNRPVVDVGVLNAATGPTVSLSSLAVTGGRNTSVPDAFQPGGGGIRVESGATLTLERSLIAGNSVRSLGPEPCGSNTCSRALGAGIANYGRLMLNKTTVSNNSSLIRNAMADLNGGHGGGIYSSGTASLNLNNCVIVGNLVDVTSAKSWSTDDGMAARGGGVDAVGAANILNSTVSANKVAVVGTGKQQTGVLLDLGGGLNIAGATTIRGSRIVGNSVSMTAYAGAVSAAAGGISEPGSLLLVNSDVSHNHVRSTITSSLTSAGASTDGGAMEGGGNALTVSHTRFVGNTMMSTSPAGLGNGGTAAGSTLFVISNTPVTMTGILVSGSKGVALTKTGTAYVSGGIVNGSSMTLINSRVEENTFKAVSSTGTATVQGAGLLNVASLTLKSTTVTKNTGIAVGTGGEAHGGGIWNSGNPAPQLLALTDSAITHNVLTASSPKISVKGGGVFSTIPVTRKNSIIALNVPDQCFGC